MFPDTMQLNRFRRTVLAAVLFLLILGCAGGSEIGNPENGVYTNYSDPELEAYIKENLAASVVPYPLLYPSVNSTATDGAAPEVSRAEDDSGENFSTTNIQEQGVDESDRVKTNGTYFFVAGDSGVTIVDAKIPSSMSIASRIAVDGQVLSLYLYGDTLVVLYTPVSGEGGQWSGTSLPGRLDVGMAYWIPIRARVGVRLVDISDPTNPAWIQEMVLDGSLVSSRLIDGKLHLVQQFLPVLPTLDLYYTIDSEKDAAIANNQQALESLSLDDLVPFYSRIGDNGKAVATGRLVASGNFYCPKNPSGGTIVTVTTLPVSNPAQAFHSVGLIADAHGLYASTQNLYISSTSWYAASSGEDVTYSYRTGIYQFSLAGDRVTYGSSGFITGKTLNQFSFDEYQGVLRVAATTGDTWQGNARNHVYCLRGEAGRLQVIGSAENIAPGERIYAARFIGTRGYLVTFVKVDPLFTLDLSDPENPRVAGELKVPGYSDYIHPLGENTLLTIGKDAREQNGATYYQGIHLSLFDVSDFASPKLLYTALIGDRGTGSDALFDHKAFNFLPSEGLLAFPVDLYEHLSTPENAWSYGTQTFTGMYTYQVSVENGFQYKGRITQCRGGVATCSTAWTRARFVDDRVFEIDPGAVRTAPVDDLSGPADEILLDQ